jgi:hypothetical protein
MVMTIGSLAPASELPSREECLCSLSAEIISIAATGNPHGGEWLRSLWQLSCWLPRWDTRGADRYYTVDGALVVAVGARVALA